MHIAVSVIPYATDNFVLYYFSRSDTDGYGKGSGITGCRSASRFHSASGHSPRRRRRSFVVRCLYCSFFAPAERSQSRRFVRMWTTAVSRGRLNREYCSTSKGTQQKHLLSRHAGSKWLLPQGRPSPEKPASLPSSASATMTRMQRIEQKQHQTHYPGPWRSLTPTATSSVFPWKLKRLATLAAVSAATTARWPTPSRKLGRRCAL